MAHVFTGWMAFESGKTFLLSLKLFQQVVLVQIAKLTLTEYLLGQESLTRAVGRSENLGIIINPRHFWENTLLFFLSKSGGGATAPPGSDALVLPPPTYGHTGSVENCFALSTLKLDLIDMGNFLCLFQHAVGIF